MIQSIKPLRRVITFTNRVEHSIAITKHWNTIIENAIQDLPENQYLTDFTCETDHVDGKTKALNRKRSIDWLKKGHGRCLPHTL